MSYSDLLARQEKDFERLTQTFYADQATLRQLQNEHYDKARFAGQLDRRQELHERQVKDLQSRFAQEQRSYLGEPDPLAPLPNISQSQDKAIEMIKAHRQKQAEPVTTNHPDKRDQSIQQPNTAKGQPVDEAEVKKLAQQAREKRDKKHQQPWRGYRR